MGRLRPWPRRARPFTTQPSGPRWRRQASHTQAPLAAPWTRRMEGAAIRRDCTALFGRGRVCAVATTGGERPGGWSLLTPPESWAAHQDRETAGAAEWAAPFERGSVGTGRRA